MSPRLRSRPSVVCVVDDDYAVRRALAFALDLEGFRVETYETGEALMARKARARVTCVVLDERLPGASGLQTLALLRAKGLQVPAILVTSHPTLAYRDAAAAAGAPILEKPLMGETLIAAIRQAIDPGTPAHG